MKFMQMQQGDLLLRMVESIPRTVKIVKPIDGSYILAEGEVTGHAHRIKDDVRLYRGDDGQMYIETDKSCKLLHEEHKPICLPPGIYQAWQVREYDHIQESIRRVTD